jgi:hypothetical protein
MEIRNYQRGKGDEEAQASIYNEAAAGLPKFKPANTQEVSRRVAAKDFDPSLRFYAIENGQPVGYALFNANGRVSYPWCRKGYERLAAPLFQKVLEAMAQRGHKKALAAYRGDWPEVVGFFRQHGFDVAREMVSFILDAVNMPTMPARPTSAITPLDRRDVPALFALAPHVVRCATAKEFEHHLCDNPYFPASAVFVLRGRADKSPVGAGVFIRNPDYADAKVLDAGMPCFRLGSFGAEGMQAKRVNGLFSILCRDDGQAGAVVADLMKHAITLLSDADDIATLAAQVPSDAPNLLRFYQMTWQRQGSFPVLEKKFE